jgi:type II secretory pathway pseudopilin PulG
MKLKPMDCHVNKKSGLTLVEMTLVIATIALLVGFGLPAVRSLVHSFESQSGTRSMISAALSSARAMAVRNQRYTGVRFQKLCRSRDPLDPLIGAVDAPQYMIFIVHEEPKHMGGMAIGFRAVEGLEPVKLPDTVAVMDISQLAGDADIDEGRELNDASAFSIVFSPSGKLVVREVRVRNRDGHSLPSNDSGSNKMSLDQVFNSALNITQYGRGMFIQDDYSVRNLSPGNEADYGLGKEMSRTSFVICDRLRLTELFHRKQVWSEYLSKLSGEDVVYVSPHTGTLISSE